MKGTMCAFNPYHFSCLHKRTLEQSALSRLLNCDIPSVDKVGYKDLTVCSAFLQEKPRNNAKLDCLTVVKREHFDFNEVFNPTLLLSNGPSVSLSKLYIILRITIFLVFQGLGYMQRI